MFSVQDASTVFTLTDAAARQGEEPDRRPRATPTSCCGSPCAPAVAPGLSYEMFFDTDVADDDIKAEHGGVTVVIDPASAPHLGGASLDFKDGLQGAGFAINNPNARAQLRLRPELQLATRVPGSLLRRLLLLDERVEERLHLGAAERAVDARLDDAGAVDAEEPRLALEVPGVDGRHERGAGRAW